MEKKMLFIFNPKAGKGKIKANLLDIVDIFNKGGYEVSCIGIDPRSGKVWLASGCYGYSTINPPYTSKK